MARGLGRDVVDDAAVAKEDDPVGPRGEMGVVGDDDRGDAALARIGDQLHHRLAVRRVERPRRLVGKEQTAFADHGPGDRDSLALAAGELIGIMPGPVGEPEPLERRHAGRVRPPRRKAVELEGQRHVLERGEAGQEIEVLEDVADRPAAKACLVVPRHLRQRRARR